MNSGLRQRWVWAIPVLAALLFHLNVLSNGFGWDDEITLQSINLSEPWWTLFLPDSTQDPHDRGGSTYFRPALIVSYLLDLKVWGMNPFGLHLSVWLAHGLNTALVFFLGKALLKAKAKAEDLRTTTSFLNLTLNHFPLFVASLFAVHPVHAASVAWIAGRSDVFCTTFLLASLLFNIRSRQAEDGRWKLRNGILFGLSMLSFALALLTKEIAVGLILLFPLYDYLSGSPNLWRRIAIRGLTPFAILTVYFWIRSSKVVYLLSNTPSPDFFSSSAAAKMVGAAGFYLKQMLFPYPHYAFIATLPTSGLFFVLAGLAWVPMLGGVIYALIRREVLFGIGLSWTVLFLAPAIAVPVIDVKAFQAAEWYVYAPSVGFLIAIAWLIMKGLDRLMTVTGWPKQKAWVVAGLLWIFIMSGWGWASWDRNGVWKNQLTFWQAAIASSPDSGFPYGRLGVQYYQRRQYAEAEPLYRRFIAIDEKVLGPDHPDVATGLNLLGVLYRDQGRYAEAEPVYQRALKIRENALGTEHTDTAASLNNLAGLYYAQGRYAEAEPLYRRVIAVDEKVLGPDHPDLAGSLNNFAGLYDAQGRYAEAEPLYRRSLTIREKSFGPDHPDVAQTLNNLAVLYQRQGRYAEAEPLHRRSLSIREKNLGPDHPDLATGLNNLAGLYYAQGKYTEAEPLFGRALAIREKALRPDHPSLAISIENYAALLRKLNRLPEAAQLEARARAIRGKNAR